VLDHAAFGGAPPVVPKVAGRSGRALERRERRPAFFAYSANYLIDLEHASSVMLKGQPRSRSDGTFHAPSSPTSIKAPCTSGRATRCSAAKERG
jgi:hypothetical protein